MWNCHKIDKEYVMGKLEDFYDSIKWNARRESPVERSEKKVKELGKEAYEGQREGREIWWTSTIIELKKNIQELGRSTLYGNPQ